MTGPQIIDRGCSTGDCSGLPSRRVGLADMDGEVWPYCQDCADVLIRGGDEDRGPICLVTEAMIEAGASALALHNDYDPNMVPSQLWGAIRYRYRKEAEVVLTAALESAVVRDG